MRRSKGHRHHKFVRFIRAPLKAFGKARDLYVRCLTSCASRVNHGDFTGQYSGLPRSFSASSAASNNGHEDDVRELMRAASVRSLGHVNETEMFSKQHLKLKLRSKKLPKSCNVRGMGRIDEDKPCEFEEINDVAVVVEKKQDYFHPRRKSYAVTKKEGLLLIPY